MTEVSLSTANSYIHIHRAKSISAAVRKIEIWIDGQQVETIKNGEDKLIPISAGAHIAMVKMFPKFRSSEIPFSIANGETMHFELHTFKMNIGALTRYKKLWLYYIPLTWLPLVTRQFIPSQLFTPLYAGLFLALFYFVLIRNKKIKDGNSAHPIAGFYFNACSQNEPPKKAGWEWQSLIRAELLLGYCILLPYLFYTLANLHIPGPWNWMLSRSWMPATLTLYCVLGYFVTGLLYKDATYDEAESGNP